MLRVKKIRESKPEPSVVAATSVKCFFCGVSRHPRTKCPAREVKCHKCQKIGHYAKVCRSTSVSASVPAAAFSDHITLASVISPATPGALSKAVVKVSIGGISRDGLMTAAARKASSTQTLLRDFP